jgi:hypothetical protein
MSFLEKKRRVMSKKLNARKGRSSQKYDREFGLSTESQIARLIGL